MQLLEELRSPVRHELIEVKGGIPANVEDLRTDRLMVRLTIGSTRRAFRYAGSMGAEYGPTFGRYLLAFVTAAAAVFFDARRRRQPSPSQFDKPQALQQ